MKNLKKHLKASEQLGTHILLIGVGTAALWMGARNQVITPAVAVIAGVVCVILGLSPMFWAYVKQLYK